MAEQDQSLFDRISGNVTDNGAYLRVLPEKKAEKGEAKKKTVKKDEAKKNAPKSTVTATPEGQKDKAVRELGNKKQLDTAAKKGTTPNLNTGSTTITSPVPASAYQKSSSNLSKVGLNLAAPGAGAGAPTNSPWTPMKDLYTGEPFGAAGPIAHAAQKAAVAETPEAASKASSELVSTAALTAGINEPDPETLDDAKNIAANPDVMEEVKKTPDNKQSDAMKLALALSPALAVLAGYALGGRTGALIGGQAVAEGAVKWGETKAKEDQAKAKKSASSWKKSSYKIEGKEGNFLAFVEPSTGEVKKITDPTTGEPMPAEPGLMDILSRKEDTALEMAKQTGKSKENIAAIQGKIGESRDTLKQSLIKAPGPDGKPYWHKRSLDENGDITVDIVTDKDGNPVRALDEKTGAKGRSIGEAIALEEAKARIREAHPKAQTPGRVTAAGESRTPKELEVKGYGYAITPKDREELVKMIPIKKQLDTNVATAMRLRAKLGGGAVWRSADTDAAKRAAADIKTQLFKLKGLGVPTGHDAEMIDAIFPPDPTAFRPTTSTQRDSIMEGMKQFKSVEDERFQSTLKLRLTPYSAAPAKGAAAKSTEPVQAKYAVTFGTPRTPGTKVKANGAIYTIQKDGVSGIRD